MPEDVPSKNVFFRFVDAVNNSVDLPITWIRESFVNPNRKQYNWYHRKFPRVPTIDECYTDDAVCIYEAEQQFRRDRRVDDEIIKILRERFLSCVHYESPDVDKCQPLKEAYEEASTNLFIKYGDMGVLCTAKNAYMKQKHRLIWERRHGPVGSGMKPKEEWGQ